MTSLLHFVPFWFLFFFFFFFFFFLCIPPLSPFLHSFIHLLLPERAPLGKSGLTTGRLAEDRGATSAHDNGLSMREDGGDGEATGAFDIHKEGTGAGHEGLK